VITMNRALVNEVKRALRAKEVGRLKNMEVEAYVIGAYSDDPDEDVDMGCDAKVPLEELEVRAGDRIDCYVYGTEVGPYGEQWGLVTNLEVEIVAVPGGRGVGAVRSSEEGAARDGAV